MPDGFDIPLVVLFGVIIPVIAIIIGLWLRSTIQPSKHKSAGHPVLWATFSGILGLLVWYLVLPYFGGLSIHIFFYGILITLGVVVATFLTVFEAKRRGFDTEIVWDAFFWVVLAGIVGARIWHILTPPPSMVAEGKTTLFYLKNPIEMFLIRKGGLGIPGAVIGGAIALLVYCRRRKLSFLAWADIVAPGVALAQAIGRWGNYFNQELYGAPTNLPWKIFIDPIHRVPGFEKYDYFHPLFLYEALWNLANFFILFWLSRRYAERLKPGDILLSYAIIYSVGRFSLDFLRLDASLIGGINANQTFAAIVALVAAGLLIWRHWPADKGKAKRKVAPKKTKTS